MEFGRVRVIKSLRWPIYCFFNFQSRNFIIIIKSIIKNVMCYNGEEHKMPLQIMFTHFNSLSENLSHYTMLTLPSNYLKGHHMVNLKFPLYRSGKFCSLAVIMPFMQFGFYAKCMVLYAIIDYFKCLLLYNKYCWKDEWLRPPPFYKRVPDRIQQ